MYTSKVWLICFFCVSLGINISDMFDPAHLMNLTMSFEDTVNMTDKPDQKGLRTSDNCHTNDWDRGQYCLCGAGRKIYYFRSWHDNHREDRRFDFRCAHISGASSSGWNGPYNSGWNGWDGTFYWDGTGSNSYMVGMQSYHDNGREDRRFNLKYRNSNSWKLSACTSWIMLNTYDRLIQMDAGQQVIGAFYSYHNNHHEDREFLVKLCSLVRK